MRETSRIILCAAVGVGALAFGAWAVMQPTLTPVVSVLALVALVGGAVSLAVAFLLGGM